MNQLTIRGFDDELAGRIRQLASRERILMNRAALRPLRRGTGLGERNGSTDTVGASLDHLIGTWTEEEAAAMNQTLEDLSHIDEAMWQSVTRQVTTNTDNPFKRGRRARDACARPKA